MTSSLIHPQVFHNELASIDEDERERAEQWIRWISPIALRLRSALFINFYHSSNLSPSTSTAPKESSRVSAHAYYVKSETGDLRDRYPGLRRGGKCGEGRRGTGTEFESITIYCASILPSKCQECSHRIAR